VVIETSEGVTDRSTILFGRGDQAPAMLAHPINDEIAPAVVGEDAFLIQRHPRQAVAADRSGLG
jgi:hypothetical protein